VNGELGSPIVAVGMDVWQPFDVLEELSSKVKLEF
jgi:hypothetical protein